MKFSKYPFKIILISISFFIGLFSFVQAENTEETKAMTELLSKVNDFEGKIKNPYCYDSKTSGTKNPFCDTVFTAKDGAKFVIKIYDYAKKYSEGTRYYRMAKNACENYRYSAEEEKGHRFYESDKPAGWYVCTDVTVGEGWHTVHLSARGLDRYLLEISTYDEGTNANIMKIYDLLNLEALVK